MIDELRMTGPRRTLLGTLPLLLAVLAFALRVFYLPAHLTLEEHVGPGQHPLSHGSDGSAPGEGHVGHGHEDRHDHDGDHSPHPASDHDSELIARTAPSHQRSAELPALPAVEGRALPAPRERFTAAHHEPAPPGTRPRITHQARGPPTAA